MFGCPISTSTERCSMDKNCRHYRLHQVRVLCGLSARICHLLYEDSSPACGAVCTCFSVALSCLSCCVSFYSLLMSIDHIATTEPKRKEYARTCFFRFPSLVMRVEQATSLFRTLHLETRGRTRLRWTRVPDAPFGYNRRSTLRPSHIRRNAP